jgi:glycosyltransferase involved in cell wall biosynthesis
MNSDVKVSVVVPVFNTVDYLAECLDSIVGQTLSEIEVIIVDDGSTDGSFDLAQRYASQDSRMSLCRSGSKGVGPGAARNLGIKSSTGEYVAFIDSDDIIDVDMLRDMYERAIVHRSDVVMCQIAKFSDAGSKEKFGRCSYDQHIPGDLEGASFTWRDLDNVFLLRFASCNKIYRREYLVQNDLTYTEGAFYEDMVFTYRALLQAGSLQVVRKEYYLNRRQRVGATTFTQGGHVYGALSALTELEEFLFANDSYRALELQFSAFKFSKLFEYLHKNDAEHMPAFYDELQRCADDKLLDENPFLSENLAAKRELIRETELLRFLVWEIWEVKTKYAKVSRQKNRLRSANRSLRARNERLSSRKVFRIERNLRNLQRRLVGVRRDGISGGEA